MHSLLTLVCFVLHIVFLNADNELQRKNNKILSRKKRYLIFPEGSSFQLVYCLTMPTYGLDIFTMGLTAALAWELPHEPIHFKKEKSETSAADKRIDQLQQNQTMGLIYNPPITVYRNPWTSTNWKEDSSAHHYITNEAFQPQSDGQSTIGRRNNWASFRQHGDVHRRTRRDLFEKIEKFFQAQNKDGRACLLKALCEVNQTNNSQKGTFVQEILRAIFTWIPAEEEDKNHKEFDSASTHKGNCSEKYPTCAQSVWNPFF